MILRFEKLKTAPPGFQIVQRHRAKFHGLISPVVALVWVVWGQKILSSDREKQKVDHSMIVFLPDNTPIAVENVPDENAPYEARVLVLERDLIERTYQRVSISDEERRAPFQLTEITPAIEEAFFRAQDSVIKSNSIPAAIVEGRCAELILWLTETQTYLNWAQPSSFADRVRSLVSANPGHHWTSTEAAKELATSEASLRRKLAKQETSFRSVLLDVRMSAALNYLQTTHWRVDQVSVAVGYQSQSRFSERFKERFGIHPKFFR